MATTQPTEPRTAVRGRSLALVRIAVRRTAPFLSATGAAAAALAVLATIDPNEPGHYPMCPLLATTGLYCPGCGSLRAVHDLLHGDLHGALARNPLTVLAVPVLLIAWLGWARRSTGRRAPHPTSLPPAAVWGVLVVVVGFWVLRNLPGMTWLSPA